MHIIGNPNQLPSGAEAPTGGFTKARFCAATNTTTDPEGFIDTTNVFPGTDSPVLLSIGAVREMARMIGMVSEEKVESLVREFEVRLDAQQVEAESTRALATKAVELEKARLLVANADKETE